MTLPTLDLAVLLVYLAAVVAFGCWFVRRSGTTRQFMAAGGALPGWAVGLSIFGTYLSSNTFLGVPGKAFGSNWNSFVFSLSLPIAVILASRFFVPFYRRGGEISAYHHLEKRFGPWARTYAGACYLLTQLARVGSILFGVSLALQALTGWPIAPIILAAGALVTLYTLLGGIEAVIWTDVVQSIVLMGGAGVVACMLVFGTPGGPGEAVSIAADAGKFSLGSFAPDFTVSTFWVVLLYGTFINLNNFGIDQSFIQRYHTASSEAAARRSLWCGALLYVPISLLFFFIGSSLFSYYTARPEMMARVKRHVAAERAKKVPDTFSAAKKVSGTFFAPGKEGQGAREGEEGYEAMLAREAEALTDADIGDKVLPDFIVRKLPGGVAGLLIAAILAAAMSSIDTSLNSSATILLTDVYKRYVHPGATERQAMRVLRGATLAVGGLGTGAALGMIGVKSVLDAWWKLSGIFAGGMLGLFLLGLATRGSRTRSGAAGAVAVLVGVLVILWLTFSPGSFLPPVLHNPFHAHMTIVVGTLTIFLVGLAANRLWRGGAN